MTTEINVIDAWKGMIAGSSLLKVGRNGKAHYRHFKLANDLSCISWNSPRKDKHATIILVSQISYLLLGQKTKVFLAKPIPDSEPLSFSLLYSNNEGSRRSLDIVCQTQQEFDLWIIGLRHLIDGFDDKAAIIKSLQDTKLDVVVNAELDDDIELNHLFAIGSVSNDHFVFGLYTWGNGANGTLGHGEDVDMPSPRVVEALLTYNVKKIACGLNTVFALNEDGKLYSWGSGKYGILGQGHLRSRYTPLKIASLRNNNIIDISCHELHTAAVTSSGELYTWGKGSQNFNRLGYLCQDNQLSPELVSSLTSRTIRSVACGYNHTLALTDKGSVYAFGDNSKSQLGIGDTEFYDEPQLITTLESENIIKVACGKYHSAALSVKGNLWLWGLGDCGQLGFGEDTYLSSRPALLKLAERKAKVLDVSCGDCHTCILTAGGIIYAFGSNDYGQAVAPNTSNCYLPQRVNFNTNKKFTSVSCGSFHSAAITENGKLYTWGLEANGRLGLGDCKARSSPTEVEGIRDKKIGRVECGCKHTAALVILSSSIDKKSKSSWLTM